MKPFVEKNITMTTVKALKTRLMKLLTSSFDTFPPDRALLLSQAVLKNVCDGLPDTDKYTLAQICEELATQVKNEKVSEEDIGEEIEMALLDGRMSGKMLDEKAADKDLLRKEQASRREQAKALEAELEAKAKREAAEEASLKSKRASVKRLAARVLCSNCGGDQGACDCEAQIAEAARRAQLRKAAEKKAVKEAEKKALLDALQEDDEDEEEDEELDEEDEDDDDPFPSANKDPATPIKDPVTSVSKVTGHHSDLDNPRFILDPKEWIQLSRFHSQSDLNQALRAQYRQVFECAPHDALFVVGQWLSHAATIRAMPSLKSSYVAIREAIHGIEACRARLEFHLGKKVGAINAAAVEAELLDLQLPTDLRKARAAGRKAQKEVRRDETVPDKKPAGKPSAKKSGN